MQLLRTVDADEVSPVLRGANRKGLVLKGDDVETEIADIMAVPWEREGAMVDEIRKGDAHEVVVKAAVGAMRLLTGIADELPEGMREAVEKLGREMYPCVSPTLNTTSVDSIGDLTGSSHGAPKDGSAGTQTDLEGGARDGELSGTGSAPKVAGDAECDDMDDDGVMKDGSEPYGDVTYADPGKQADGKKRYPLDTDAHIRAAWSYINMPKNAAKYSSGDAAAIKGRIKAAMKRAGAHVAKDDPDLTEEEQGIIATIRKAFGRNRRSESSPDDGDIPEPDDGPDDTTDDAVEKGGTVDTHAVPIQKEDGSWDLSGVPEESRPYYELTIQKAQETATKLEKAEATLAETREALRTQEIITKADAEFDKIGARDDIVTVLKEAGDKLSPEGYESLVSLLSAANERVAKGDLFTEMGRTALGDGSETDAWAKIEKAADDLVEKSDTGMTRDQAVDRVLKTREGAALYDAYLRETGLGVS